MVVIQMSNNITIRSHRGEYDVYFLSNIIKSISSELSQGDFVFIDKNIYDLYPNIANVIESYKFILINPTETSKSYYEVGPLIRLLIENNFTKKNRLVGIGGGITQDITAFISSILFRGVQWYFYPTNLLSQCDSCIGSKTSINFESFKNQIGNFYPPKKIFIFTELLDTLPDKEIKSGLGEMLHYFCVDGRDSFDWAKDRLRGAVDSKIGFDDLIFKSLQIKKAMIEIDEFDEGPRNVFNYGHSFGHALESASEYTIPHGIAVGYGMDIANIISAKLEYIDIKLRNELRDVFSIVWDDNEIECIDVNRFMSALKKDKKNEGDKTKVILTKGLGHMFKSTLTIDDQFMDFVNNYFSNKLWRKYL